METIPFHVLIAAAGRGSRFGSDVPKQYHSIAGKSILRHTIEAFQQCPGLQSLRVIIDPEYADQYHDAVQGLDIEGFITGGEDRKSSINNGLKCLSKVKNEDVVLIHDAVRPLISRPEIEDVVEAVQNNQAACLALPVTDTLRREANDNYVDRDGLWALQTPQGFTYGVIKQAHEAADPDITYTDDTAMVAALGQSVTLVEGKRSNIKITTPEDLEMAAALLGKRMSNRTGQGYDVHAFDDAPGPLRIGGIDIDHGHKLKGHSDSDVALHALTDAILGAIGGGDIGLLFPPSDDTFKDMDSAVFLKKAVEMVAEQGGRITALDLTIICEAPKIGPHRDAMTTRIAEIVGINPSRINIKATTTEGLGFTGRREGIAAQAIATVELPDEA